MAFNRTWIASAILAGIMLMVAPGCILIEGGAAERTHALFAPGCGPTDGPALGIYLTEQSINCDDLSELVIGAPQEQSFVYIVLYDISEPVAGSSFTLEAEPENGPAYSEGGYAVRCEASGACVEGRQGTITFEQPLQDGLVTIEVDVRFEDGTRETGRYTASGCEQRYVCG